MMFRKMMLTGLMAATIMSGVAPAYAQSNENGRGNRGERAERGGADRQSYQWRGNGQRPLGGDRQQQAQRWQQRQDRPVAQAPAQQPRADRPRPNPAIAPAPARQDWRNDRRDDRRNDRQDYRQDRRTDRQDWRNDRRDDRQDWRQDRRDDRRDDRRWNDNRGSVGNWNNGRRYDDRTRWSNQQRWNNGWRQDRRYDWQSYRNRYGNQYRMGRYMAPRGWDYGYRRFSVGIMLSSILYSNSYWLNDPYAYRLPPAYGTLRWVRYYDDAMLVDIRDGYVVDVIHDFFW
ncbi:RcnB family protein [Sphingobium indicum]|nr:RcnB family protein [Sphingobium indicum]